MTQPQLAVRLLKVMRSPVHDPFGRLARAGIVRRLLLALLSIGVGYALASFLVVIDQQDAFQYRLNLQSGAYVADRDPSLFAWLVRTLSEQFPDSDPFITIGAFTCASYLYLGFRSGAHWYRIAAFLLLLILPLMEFNYTQVIRQGVANAFILHALFTRALPVAGIFMVIGSMLHMSYAPIAALVFLRMLFFGEARQSGPAAGNAERWHDRIMIVGIIATFSILNYYHDVLFDENLVSRYITYEANILKRLLVSSAMIFMALLLYPKTRGPIGSFMLFATISIAVVLPFAYDFLRMQTYVMPFIIFASLMCRDQNRALIALSICTAISLYVQPNL
ncbi:hypothetical protein ACQKO5_21290 [Novosphingobium subterraneum]|uniref:hypothetical protein n=1 Tax=Novosphingobium subterraneum TaxID=48936 RepID=UPI003D0669FA